MESTQVACTAEVDYTQLPTTRGIFSAIVHGDIAELCRQLVETSSLLEAHVHRPVIVCALLILARSLLGCPATQDIVDDATGQDVGSGDASMNDVPLIDTAGQDQNQHDINTQPDARADAYVVTDIVLPDRGPRPDAACPAAALASQLGQREHLLLGGDIRDPDFAYAPYDLGYRYIAGSIPENGQCSSCAADCPAAWWGCWQWDQLPPGRYVADFLQEMANSGAVPMITQYIWYTVAGQVEGAAELAALQDGARVRAFINDHRFLCQTMAEDLSIKAILHIEPDLMGYAERANSDPRQIPVALNAAAAVECAGLGNHMAGFAQCLLRIARIHAPNVFVGFHASAWGEGHDALRNSDVNLDVVAHAQTTAAFLRALGAADADLIVMDMNDRDAGYNNNWWDATDTTLPHFVQANTWATAVGDALGLAPLWWQVPFGNMALENVCNRYQDNRADYFFAHPQSYAAANLLGIAFGAGATCMTSAATDDGHFTAQAQAYYQSARPLLCGR